VMVNAWTNLATSVARGPRAVYLYERRPFVYLRTPKLQS